MIENQIWLTSGNVGVVGSIALSNVQFQKVVGGVEILFVFIAKLNEFNALRTQTMHSGIRRLHGIVLTSTVLELQLPQAIASGQDEASAEFAGKAQQQCLIRAMISHDGFREICAARKTDVAMTVRLDLTVTQELRPVQGPSHVLSGLQQLQFHHRIPQSDWINIENGVSSRKMMLLEMELPPTQSVPSLQEAGECVRRANEHIRAGLFSEAVAACRIAYECIKKIRGESNGPAWAAGGPLLLIEKSRGKDERLDAARYSLHAITHLAHHFVPGTGAVPSSEPEAQFSRADAIMIVAQTAAIVMHASQTYAIRPST